MTEPRRALRSRKVVDLREQAERKRVGELRLHLLRCHPFWGYLLAELQILWSCQLPSFAATDGVARIWLNPQWTAALTRRQLGFVLLHELGHIVLESLDRQEKRQAYLWNCATDYAINRMVSHIAARPGAQRGPAWDPPAGELPGLGQCQILLDARFDHLPAEAIYARLLGDPSVGGLPGPPVDLLDEAGATVTSLPNHQGGIDVHAELNGDAETQQRQRDLAMGRLLRAAEAAEEQQPGRLPLGLDRWVQRQKQPALDWQTLLQRHLNGLGAAVERSWSRPHRRWLAEGWLVPGAVPERDGAVVLAIDTSGSMAQEQLQTIAGHLASLEERVSELWVLLADASIQAVVRPGELAGFLARRKWQGGGGTDHRPVFDWLKRQPWQPDLLLCCTDLHTQLPKAGPNFPVVWLVTPDRLGDFGPRPGFGDLLLVDH